MTQKGKRKKTLQRFFSLDARELPPLHLARPTASTVSVRRPPTDILPLPIPNISVSLPPTSSLSQFPIFPDVLKKGTGGWKKDVAAFGEEILQADGEVDRPKLGQIVFSDPAKRQVLNRLPVPCISSGIFREILKLWLKGHKVVVLYIPLLFEAKMDRWTKPIVVVWVDPETQLRWLMARDRTNEEDARNRMKAQMPLDLKRSKADIVIDNTGSLEDLNEQFQKALFQVMRPLTWTEFALSRQGALLALFSITVGVLAFRKASL